MGKVVCPWDTLINFVTDAFVVTVYREKMLKFAPIFCLNQIGAELKATVVIVSSRFILTELKQVFKNLLQNLKL